METVFDALKAMGKATSVELAARLDISREEVLNELWELKKAGFVDKSVYTWRVEAKTGATRYLMNILARELVASGDVYNSGYGLFTSEQARKDWNNARKKLSRDKGEKNGCG